MENIEHAASLRGAGNRADTTLRPFGGKGDKVFSPTLDDIIHSRLCIPDESKGRSSATRMRRGALPIPTGSGRFVRGIDSDFTVESVLI